MACLITLVLNAPAKPLLEVITTINTLFISRCEVNCPPASPSKVALTFSKFGSDLDAVTLNVIEKGRRNVEILKQAVNDPYTVEDQVAIIYAGSKNLLKSVPVNKVKEFERTYIDYLNNKHRDILDALKAGKLDDNITDVLEKVAKELSAKY